MEPTPGARIGDPERMAALDRLTDLFTNGYLDVAEFDSRTATAAGATHTGDLEALFADLPKQSELAVRQENAPVRSASADEELDRVLARGRKVRSADAVIWAAAMIMFFVGLFVLDWDYFWVAFPVAAFASWGVREVIGLGDDDEEIFDELEEAEKKKRAERLRVAMERRKQLGQ